MPLTPSSQERTTYATGKPMGPHVKRLFIRVFANLAISGDSKDPFTDGLRVLSSSKVLAGKTLEAATRIDEILGKFRREVANMSDEDIARTVLEYADKKGK